MTENNKIIAGVVGDPISQSLSPKLHGFWLRKYDIDGDYKAFHITEENLPDFLATLKDNGISGVNLTAPHKEQALKLVDIVDDVAGKVGAVNTIYFDNDKMIGSNTDGIGFLTHLKQSTQQWESGNGPVVILGSGGAARSVLYSLLDDGVPEIRLTNRTKERALNLANEISDDRITVYDWDQRDEILNGAALLVNVTTLGMVGKYPLEINIEKLPTSATVYDIVYVPLETELLKNARARGNECVDGLGMLLHQAVPGFEKWFGVKPEVNQALNQHILDHMK